MVVKVVGSSRKRARINHNTVLHMGHGTEGMSHRWKVGGAQHESRYESAG